MSTPVWKDATSYSRGDRERVPSAWDIVSGALRVVVVSRHRLVPGQWVMHCHELRMDTVSLGVCSSQPAERAQAEAIKLVRARLEKLTAWAQALPDGPDNLKGETA